ncbi:MAG: biotin/lipoyl-binding protein [Oscillospiraceae bacterium]|nr:biotin/lipoyl-binding protein [Oscillospiraceae bacterium]
MSIIDRLGDPNILAGMTVGEKLWGAVVTMIIGIAACMVVLAIIMYSIKLMHLVFGGKEEKAAGEEKKTDGEVVLDPADFEDGAVVISCPADGSVTALNAHEGAAVKAGDTLLILSSAGSENEVIVPEDGTIRRVLVEAGAQVRRGEALAVM